MAGPDTRQYLRACFGDAKGWLFIAVGRGPYLNDKGKYRHHKWSEVAFRWPFEADKAVEYMMRAAALGDVYACPYLMPSKDREKGRAVQRALVHSDIDRELTQDEVTELGGFVIWSGTPGHGQVYVRLAWPVTPAQHEILCRGLAARLGGDAKVSDNDVLRPPGTLNYKPTVNGGDPYPVTALWCNNGPVDPRELAGMLGVDITYAASASAGSAGPAGAARTATCEPFNLDDYPTVKAALEAVSSDRSVDTMRVVAACCDAFLTLAHARWAVAQRHDLAGRLDERRDDDVLNCWLKAVDKRQQQVRDTARTGNIGGSGDGDDAAPPAGLLDGVERLEDGFWESRESLAHIYQASLARMCSPWAVLAHCAARALYSVQPRVRLPALIGGPGSLNWFAAVVSVSGGGKSAAEDVARELINIPIQQRSLGSGEGFIESYIRPENKVTGEPEGRYEAILFVADEGDTVSALGSRSGSTLLSTLRTAWTGRTLSFGYRGRTTQQLAAHTYRATLVMGTQPARAKWLLDDASGGTPQRFQWFPAEDLRLTRDAWDGSPVHSLTLPSSRKWSHGTELHIPDAARELILSERVKAAKAEQGALDGHALFCREKSAFALAVLDGRTEMTDQDWELSGIAAAVSTHVREWVAAQCAQAAEDEAARLGTLRGITNQAADTEKSYRDSQQASRISAWIIRKLTEAGEQGLSEGELRRRADSRQRHQIGAMLAALAQRNQVKYVAATGTWVVA